MVYYVSVRKKRKSYYKNTKNRRKNSRKNTRKNKYKRGGGVRMTGMVLGPRRTTFHPPTPPTPPQVPPVPYNVVFEFKQIPESSRSNWQNKKPRFYKSTQKPEFMIHFVNNMLIKLLETIDSYIQKLVDDSDNVNKLEKFRIIVDAVITTITENDMYEIMKDDTYINYEDFLSLFEHTKQKMLNFIDDTAQFVPVHQEAKKIARNVINWIDMVRIHGETKSEISSDFITFYIENGIWSMFGKEGKKIMEDADRAIITK